MPIGLLYWILMLLWFVSGVVWWTGFNHYGFIGNSLILFLLLLILGWRNFGKPVQ